MPRRKKLPVKQNPLPLLLASLVPYAATAATVALKAVGVAIVGGTVGTAVYSRYVASEEETRRKNLPKIAEELAFNIQRLEQGLNVDVYMPNSLWVAPTDDAQASLRVAWLYMLAAIKNPQHKATLLQQAKLELAEYRSLEEFLGQSFDNPNDPALQYAYNDMMKRFAQLGINNLAQFQSAVSATQSPELIAEQQLIEKQMKDEASLTNALINSAKDSYEIAIKMKEKVTESGKCASEIGMGLLTGKKPESCDLTDWQWMRMKGVVYGTVGLAAAAYILPPFFRLAAPIAERLFEKKDK